MSSDRETSWGRKCSWARCLDGSPSIRGGSLEEASRVWKGRVLADWKRRKRRFYVPDRGQAFSGMCSLPSKQPGR